MGTESNQLSSDDLATQWPYAGFWIRFGGMLVDILLSISPLIALLPLLFFMPEILTNADVVNYISIGAYLIPLVLLFFSRIYLLGTTGQSLGYRFVNIAVLDENQAPIGIFPTIVRELLLQNLSLLVLGLGYFHMLWDAQKQTWHDKILGCFVFDVDDNVAFERKKESFPT